MEITSMEAIGAERGLPRPRFLVLAIAIVAALALSGARDAEAAVTPGEAEAAAAAGAAWFADEQQSTGALAGDWGMTALAAAGVNAADVRTGLVDPTAQDFYAGEWAAKGPGGAGTDFERAVLAGSAGGVQTSRVAANRNMVAQIAALWDGKQIGATGLLNDDIFGVLALDRVEAPQPLLAEIADVIRAKQMPNGGWSWSNGPSAVAEADITGSVLGALCVAGADAQADPAIQSALGYLHSVQDQSNGGFASPPFFPANTDSTGWVASGLLACGIDPQSLEWTTSSGKTPLDYLLSMQLDDGRFCWKDVVTCDGSAAYATWDAVRPLAGDTWSAAAPPRQVASEPAIRAAPSVAAGTEVPLALVIDYGNGEVDMCRVKVPSDSDLGTALAAAKSTATPSGCVTEGEVSSGSSGQTLEQLNGVVPAAGSRWLVGVDGGPETATTSTPIGFGDMVSLRLEGTATEAIDPPPLQPGGSGGGSDQGPPAPGSGQGQQPQSVAPAVRRAKLGGAHRARLVRKRLGARLSCPAGLGAEGCAGTVTIRYRQAGKKRTGGQAGFTLASGASRRVFTPLRPALRRLLGESGRRRVALVAATRAGDGSVAYSKRSLLLVGPRRSRH